MDILALPTMREPAPLISETVNETHQRPHSNTGAFNHFGTPAMTVPCGFSKDGLPIGLQLVGAAFPRTDGSIDRLCIPAVYRLASAKASRGAELDRC